MKVTATKLPPPPPKFVPVRVEFVLETQAEIDALYQLSNFAGSAAAAVDTHYKAHNLLTKPSQDTMQRVLGSFHAPLLTHISKPVFNPK